jgi:hypothetical protein
MIRPSNIDTQAHTADFRCDQHDAYEMGLNLNTVAEYQHSNIYDEQSPIIAVKVLGTMLTQGSESCTCGTWFPIANGDEDAQLIVQAKTA